MDLSISYEGGGEKITVALEGDFDHLDASNVIEAVIKGEEVESVESASVDELAEELSKAQSQMKTLAIQRDNAEEAENRLQQSNTTLALAMESLEKDFLGLKQELKDARESLALREAIIDNHHTKLKMLQEKYESAVQFGESKGTALAELERRWNAHTCGSGTGSVAALQELTKMHDELARGVHALLPNNYDKNPMQVLALLGNRLRELEQHGMMAERELLDRSKAGQEQVDRLVEENRRLREENFDALAERDPGVSMIKHPASEDGDERVAIVPLLPNGSLVMVLRLATVLTDKWVAEFDEAFVLEEAGNGQEAESLSVFEQRMRALKAELDKVWELPGEAGWSHVKWIRATALKNAPEGVRAWIEGLESA